MEKSSINEYCHLSILTLPSFVTLDIKITAYFSRYAKLQMLIFIYILLSSDKRSIFSPCKSLLDLLAAANKMPLNC
jgi:hypothetical protein